MNLHQSSSLRRLIAPVAVATVVAAMLPALAVSPAVAADGGIHVNFQPAGATPAGYTADTGAAFNGTSGWQDLSGNPVSLTGNTRIRNSASSPDARYDTFLVMQLLPTSSGNQTPGRYVATLPNGAYDVTVGMGDAGATNSVDVLTAQPGTADSTLLVDHFQATSTNLFTTATKRVNVSNGQLILDPTGGTQDKIDFVDAVPAAQDVTPPAVKVVLSGTQTGDASSPYSSAVTVTASATDTVGVTGLTYSLDGGVTTAYTAPFKVNSVGDHTVVVTAVDAAANTGTATSTFTIASLLPTSVHTNFQPTGTVPAGYTADTGKPFNGSTGWTDVSGNPLDMSANTRIRNSANSPDPRYDTLLIMQGQSGQLTPGRWTTPLNNGSYDVTVGVGDATAVNSVYEVTAQPGTADATVIIDHVTPTAAKLFATVTKRVTVSNGQLTLDPTGGTQTKIDFVDAVPAATDGTAPVATLALSGTLSAGAGSPYSSVVTVTGSATDNVAVTGLTYTLDGGASQAYTAPFAVSSVGNHTVVLTAVDAAGNTGTATSTFSIASLLPTNLHVNFAAQTSATPAGYVNDYGVAYADATGMGWESANDGTPTSLVGNGRERNLAASPDKRYDTMIQMQQTASSSTGTQTPGQWEHALTNGSYDVTVAVGDASAVNSVDRITLEPGTANAVTIINNFVPTAGSPFSTVTKRITVSDGKLTLNAAGGGVNTKIDFIDAVPAAGDNLAPVVGVTLTGTLLSGTTYNGPVQVTATATDNVGVVTETYTVDGGTATPYTVPFTVSATGDHTVVVTAIDAANNTTTKSAGFTISDKGPSSFHVNFAAQTSATPAGYVNDYGLAYTATAGMGWESANDGTADLAGRQRSRAQPRRLAGQALRHDDPDAADRVLLDRHADARPVGARPGQRRLPRHGRGG